MNAAATHLLAEAEGLLREGRAEDALPIASRALDMLGSDDTMTATAALPALTVVAEIYLELGDGSSAREYFLQAVSLDPEGQVPETEGGGAEKFLWLAQLSSDGGQDSVEWFSRGAGILRREIGHGDGEKRPKLASALCGIIEVYMTDLSWDPDAEATCEKLISEALIVAPHSPEPLQTLASIRLSQARLPEARQALANSVALWHDLPPDDAAVPDFPTRISLARLLMEAEMETAALSILERLVQEDDSSVEAWYLGGWCLYLLGGKQRQRPEGNGTAGTNDAHGSPRTLSWTSSCDWLRQSLTLYELVGYEDERMREHAVELVGEMDAVVGEADEWDGFEDGDGSEEEEEEEKWGGEEDVMDQG